jgi:hypothetical protein
MQPIPEDWTRGIAVVAHPDDLEYGVASAVARWTVRRAAAAGPGRRVSLREHRAYIGGLGGDFDPDEFLRNMAGYVGLGAGCEYAVGFRRYPIG